MIKVPICFYILSFEQKIDGFKLSNAIDNEHFSNGIYFVQLKDNSGVIFATKKLIKN